MEQNNDKEIIEIINQMDAGSRELDERMERMYRSFKTLFAGFIFLLFLIAAMLVF